MLQRFYNVIVVERDKGKASRTYENARFFLDTTRRRGDGQGVADKPIAEAKRLQL